jgi:hypothetical protein
MLPELAIFKLGSLNPRVQCVVEPAASFVAHVDWRARTIYVGPEEPENAALFTEWDCGAVCLIQTYCASHMRNSLAERSVHCSFAYSALACFTMGMSGSAQLNAD